MNKKQFKRIRKEYVDAEKSLYGYFICNTSPTFRDLWHDPYTQQEIVRYATIFLKEKKIEDKVDIGRPVLFTYTKEFGNSFYNKPNGEKLQDVSYRTLRVEFIDWLISKLDDETHTTI